MENADGHPQCVKCKELVGRDTGEPAFICAPCNLPRVCRACFESDEHRATCSIAPHIDARLALHDSNTEEK